MGDNTINLFRSRQRKLAGCFEYGNEPSGSKKWGGIIYYLYICWFLKMTLLHGVISYQFLHT